MSKDNLGLGVMIQMLSGNEEAAKAIETSKGKEITSISLDDENIRIEFKDSPALNLWDSGQSCCENRYLTKDDQPDFSSFVGATFNGIEIKEGEGSQEEEYSEKDHLLIHLLTSKGAVLFSAWNEHNGYYGGFWITAELDKPTPDDIYAKE